MNEEFKAHISVLEKLCEKLEMAELHSIEELMKILPTKPLTKGVYLFSNGDNNLYVGRTDRMRARVKEQQNTASDGNSASLAFLMARKETGNHRGNGKSRKDLLCEPKFYRTFGEMKKIISGMKVRYITEEDPIRQDLLKIYVHLVLGTKYNNFDNH